MSNVFTAVQYVCRPKGSSGPFTTLPIGVVPTQNAIVSVPSPTSPSQTGSASATDQPSQSSTANIPTVTFNPPISPFPSAAAPNAEPNSLRPLLYVALSTNVPIYTIPAPTPTPIDSFRPLYDTRLDGSLVTPLYDADLGVAKMDLFLIGALFMLFVRNIFVSVDYLRRGRTKDKSLFYTLLASQLMGPICFLALLMGYINPKSNCAAVNVISAVAVTISYSLLITGILGVKAYRYLKRSRVVLLVLTTLQLLIFFFFAVDVPKVESLRSLSGTCITYGTLRFLPISIALTLIESLFICSCFLFAAYKSYKSPAAQGRTSIRLSAETTSMAPSDLLSPTGRGWWDHAATDKAPSERSLSTTNAVAECERPSFGNSIRQLLGIQPDPVVSPPRKSSIASDRPFAILEEKYDNPEHQVPSMRGSFSGSPIAPPPTGSTKQTSPRISALRAMLKNEIVFTAAVAISCIVATVLTVIGIFRNQQLWGPSIMLDINWAITSLLIMRNYGLVVKRHEKDAVAREATNVSTQQNITRFGQDINPNFAVRRRKAGQPGPTFSISTFPSSYPASPIAFQSRDLEQGTINPISNPFEDHADSRRGSNFSVASDDSSSPLHRTSQRDSHALVDVDISEMASGGRAHPSALAELRAESDGRSVRTSRTRSVSWRDRPRSGL